MSIAATKKFLAPDPEWDKTVWGRIDQGRRELAAAIRKDVTVEKLAELIGRSGPSFTAWKTGESRPKRDSLEALERVFLDAGLVQFTARFLDYGPEPSEVKVARDRKGPPPGRGGAEEKRA